MPAPPCARKSLAQVERAFRSLKTVDLDIRPVFHWTAPRVRAHVFLCLLAYHLEWHLRQALAPMLFDDHDRATAEAGRASAVAEGSRQAASSFRAAYYAIGDSRWDRAAFMVLYELFQVTVTDVSRVGIPIHHRAK